MFRFVFATITMTHCDSVKHAFTIVINKYILGH